jgi:PII-like signaling protein
LPVLIVIIDTAENIEGFLPQLEQLEVRGVIALDDVEVIASGPSAQQ